LATSVSVIATNINLCTEWCRSHQSRQTREVGSYPEWRHYDCVTSTVPHSYK